jgi:hypothetical protein
VELQFIDKVGLEVGSRLVVEQMNVVEEGTTLVQKGATNLREEPLDW